MKNPRLMIILFITTLLVSISFPLLSLTMNQKKARDIQEVTKALTPNQRVILSHSYSCNEYPSWNNNTQLVFNKDAEGSPISFYVPSLSNQSCSEFYLEKVDGIQVEDTSTGRVIKSIYW